MSGYPRNKTVQALRSLFRFAKRRGVVFTNPAAGIKAPPIDPAMMPMTDDEIRAIESLAGRPAERLAVALAAEHAARTSTIRHLKLGDVDLPNRRITLASHNQRLGDLTYRAMRDWLGHRRATWPHSPNPHVLISKRTALGTGPVSHEAAAGLIISHGSFLRRDDFARHVETAACISDGTPMAWIDWDAAIAALDSGRLPASGGEKRIVHIAASLAAGHLGSLRDAIPGLDHRSLENWSPPRSATPPGGASEPQPGRRDGACRTAAVPRRLAAIRPRQPRRPLTRFVGSPAYGPDALRDDFARFRFLLGITDGEGVLHPRRAAVRETSRAPVLADFVCSVEPGAADGVAFDGGDHVIEGEAGWQAGGLVEGEELEDVGVGSV